MKSSCRTPLLLLILCSLCFRLAEGSSPNSVRYSLNYWVFGSMNTTQQQQCLNLVATHSTRRGSCYDMAECILENLSEYAKVGLASGTTILTLVPSAVALIPSRDLGVEEAFEVLGFFYLLLATFAGYTSVGESAKRLGAEIAKGDDGYEGTPELGRFSASTSRLPRYLQFSLYILVVILAGVVCYLATRLGLKTVVTWACNHEFLHLGWLFCRMAPGIAELLLLRLLRSSLRARPSWTTGGTASRGWILTEAIRTLSLALWGLVFVYGTGLFGSTNLIDGSTAIWLYMLLFPLLYAAMQILLDICILLKIGTKPDQYTSVQLQPVRSIRVDKPVNRRDDV